MTDIELAVRYQPYFYFHKDETEMPADYEVLIADSQLMNGDTVIMQRDANQPYNEYIDKVVTYSQAVPSCRLNVPSSLWGGALIPPLYASFRETDDMYIINYTLAFGYNGNTFLSFGAHMMDIEHVTVRITKSVHELLDVYYGAHQTYDGVWRRKNELEMVDGHPVVYCAKTSHAMYPNAGNYVYAYGTSIDRCNRDRLLFPRLLLITRDRPNWLEYMGQASIGTKPYLTQDETLIQTTPFRRFVRIPPAEMLYLTKKYTGPYGLLRTQSLSTVV